jgi:Protein of unknown function (DUF3892)
MTYYVVCIEKHPYHTDPHTRIQLIGTNTSGSATWSSKTWTIPEAIRAIRSGDMFYSADHRGDLARVIVASHNGLEYIKTEADGIQPDNLLAKPEC